MKRNVRDMVKNQWNKKQNIVLWNDRLNLQTLSLIDNKEENTNHHYLEWNGAYPCIFYTLKK